MIGGLEVEVLAIGAAAFAAWTLVLFQRISAGNLPVPLLLSANVWATTGSGCAIAVIHRSSPDNGIERWILVAGTATFVSLFGVALLAARSAVRSSHGLLVALAIAFTLVEAIYLSASAASPSDHAAQVASLVFFPGIVLQIWWSGASQRYLLHLAYRVTAFVTFGSVALAALAPDLAFGDGPTDLRRLAIGPLTHRLAGLTPHPNYLSVTAIICLLLCVFLHARNRTAVVVTCLVALALAESRVAIVSLGLVAVVVWVLNGKSPLRRVTIAAPLTAAILIWSGSLLPSDESALTADISTNGRLRVWGITWQLFLQDPWQGFGPLGFEPESQSPLLGAGLLHAHNQVLQGIAEGGWIGGLLTVVILGWIVWIAISNRAEFIYPCVAVMVIVNCMTEPLLSMHRFGLNYAAVFPIVIWIIFMSGSTSDASGTRRTPSEQLGEDEGLSDDGILSNPTHPESSNGVRVGFPLD